MTENKEIATIYKALDLAGMANWNYIHDKDSELAYSSDEYSQSDIDAAYESVKVLQRENERLLAFAEEMAIEGLLEPFPMVFDTDAQYQRATVRWHIAVKARELLASLAVKTEGERDGGT